MLRTVKSKEDLLKIFKDEKNYIKLPYLKKYYHKDTRADFREEMFELCGKIISVSKLEYKDWVFDKYQFESIDDNGETFLFREDWLVPISEESDL